MTLLLVYLIGSLISGVVTYICWDIALDMKFSDGIGIFIFCMLCSYIGAVIMLISTYEEYKIIKAKK